MHRHLTRELLFDLNLLMTFSISTITKNEEIYKQVKEEQETNQLDFHRLSNRCRKTTSNEIFI